MQYKELTIEKFRGIEKLTITDLKQVNLLVGRNNCGKTTVLEALFLLSGMSNPQLVVNIHHFRDLVLANDENFNFMFLDMDFNNTISLSAALDNTSRTLIIKPWYADFQSARVIKDQQITPQDLISSSNSVVHQLKGLKLEFQNGQNSQFNTIRISLKEEKVVSKTDYKETLRCSFTNPKTAMLQIEERMQGLLVQKRLDRLISVLKGIEPDISDIRMGAAGMIFVDIGKEKLLPLNILGDGIRRLLALLVTIADMKNGVVLVDEIDNGLHYSSLAVLWKAIIAACKEYNVQLIATTHSYECIEAFSTAYGLFAPQGDDIRLFRIDRHENQHQVYTYNAEILRAGIEKKFEVR
ncbi:AAA family ATPase [candidate division KSB1 bacterium]|nr:AAA family ATPase [candidate division KSB1 bacterium]